MIKIAVYGCRTFDEEPIFDKYAKELGIELLKIYEPLTLDTVHLSKGCYGISILYTVVERDVMQALVNQGIKHMSLRCIGYDCVDLESAKELGLEVSNISYDISSVAEYTVMLMMMSLRKYKYIHKQANVNDFSLPNKMGKSIQGSTIGVIGTGAIGSKVIKILSGYNCKVLAYDLYPRDDLKGYCEYVTLDELYKESDAITLHTPATKDNFHMINKETINKMKDGVVIINCARGALINTQDLIEAVKSRKVSNVALDAIEDEMGLYFNDLSHSDLVHDDLNALRSSDHIIVSPHMAWYTDGAVDDMVINSLTSIIKSYNHEENKYRLV